MAPIAAFHLLPDPDLADPNGSAGWASAGAPLVKCCSAKRALACLDAGARAVYLRPADQPDDGPVSDGAAWARTVLASLAAAGLDPNRVAALGYRNEIPADAAMVASYTAYRATLRAAGYRGLVVLGSFSVGTPDWPDYQWIAAAKPDAVEIHEYVDLTLGGSAPDYAWRHVEALRRGLLDPALLLIVGEFDADALTRRLPDGTTVPLEDPQGRRGWDDRGKLSAMQAAALLDGYLAGCAPSVAVVCWFADGARAGATWACYHSRGALIESAIRATWSAHPDWSLPMGNQDPAAAGDTPANDVVTIDQNWGQPWLKTLHCGDTAAAEVLQALGKRPAGLTDEQWVQQVFAWVHPGVAWSEGGVLTAPSAIVAGIQGRFPDVQVQLIQSEAELEQQKAAGHYVEGFVAQQVLDGSAEDAFIHLDILEQIKGGMVHVADSDRSADHGSDWYPLTIWRAAEEAAPTGGYGIAFWSTAPAPTPTPPNGGTPMDPQSLDAAAQAHYFLNGVRVDTSHAIWTKTLLPLFADAQAAPAAVANLRNPGPIVRPEAGTTWGPERRPASIVWLSNRVVGVYLDAEGQWQPYQEEVF